MFHKIDAIPPQARYPGNYVTPERFDRLLAAVRNWGYESITLDDWISWRANLAELPPRPIVLTFDDGYRSNHTVAWPLLQRYGMGATIFVVTGLLAGTNRWDADEIQEPLLSADEIRTMHAAGIRFGSHTRTHIGLPGVPAEQAVRELRGSREDLEHVVGQPVTAFCYPYSKQVPSIRRLVQEAGYSVAVRGGGRVNGRGTDPFALRRIKVEDTTNLESLKRQLDRPSWIPWK